ncbi:MAG: hypothetical protein E6R04_01610 [Spirochaetes bacterium]|nr:MAG: hypothetical protein E6R04_01610 [Spirochaetota bacterium]
MVEENKNIHSEMEMEELISKYVCKQVDHELNRAVAAQFGVIFTHVKVFETDKGWLVLDSHTKRPLHKGIKNKQEIDELCRKHGYIEKNKK